METLDINLTNYSYVSKLETIAKLLGITDILTLSKKEDIRQNYDNDCIIRYYYFERDNTIYSVTMNILSLNLYISLNTGDDRLKISFCKSSNVLNGKLNIDNSINIQVSATKSAEQIVKDINNRIFIKHADEVKKWHDSEINNRDIQSFRDCIDTELKQCKSNNFNNCYYVNGYKVETYEHHKGLRVHYKHNDYTVVYNLDDMHRLIKLYQEFETACNAIAEQSMESNYPVISSFLNK